MAGIEKLEIHSKSYVVRWVKVDEGHTISWSVQPHKKSINFGIVKHPGSSAASQAAANVDELNKSFDNLDGSATNTKNARSANKRDGTAQEQLASKGFPPLKWHGKCEADKVSMGTFDVLPGQGGTFGLVFDNTFSKQTSKTATFVLLTYPTGHKPQGAHYLPNLQGGPPAAKSSTSLAKAAPAQPNSAAASVDSLHSHGRNRAVSAVSVAARSDGGQASGAYHTGNLLKRRRKKGQGYARRYFSLDYSTCTLSYYYNRNSSALRGAVPLSLAAIAADERRREISIDSGAEVWHLRASNAKDFADWAKALERASRIARGLEPGPSTDDADPADQKGKLSVPQITGGQQVADHHEEEDTEWQQVESLLSRVVGTRDALRRLVKDMGAQKQFTRPSSSCLSPGATPNNAEEGDGYFPAPQPERKSFWRRKSTATAPTNPQAFQPTVSSALAVPSPGAASAANGAGSKRDSNGPGHEERSVHDHCAALLNDLDTVVGEFTMVIAKSKRRRTPAPSAVNASRRSMESTASVDEFFDAEGGETESGDGNQVMMIDHRSEEDSQGSEADEASIHSSSSASTDEDEEPLDANSTAALFPAKPKSLHPLPIDIAVERRRTIPAATVQPPSLIAFVRKNVGKDLSTISMPVSANEPTSLLQRVAEQLEYAQLLDDAAKRKTPNERLLYVAAFAVSQFSNNRAKERTIRKPFNPLLGETFELLRTESELPGGFRLIVEKVCHRPVRLAMHADSANWSFAQSPAPSQKFWGKSAELTTEGKVRVALRLPDGTDELYSWNIATMFLRNVVMGEKYVEPVGSMSVCNDSTGAKANIEFRTKGMFGGRSEEVQVDAYGPDGAQTGMSLTGNWTSSLQLSERGRGGAGQEIWRVGELVPNPANTYGMTTFAASLNEVTDIEKGRLPVTDTRQRPDQRLCEQGRLDAAEEEKVRLEEAQRVRRRELEQRGEAWRPRWFVKVAGGEGGEGEEVWRLKGGKESYWDARERGFKDVAIDKIF